MNPPARILFPIAVDPRALLDFNDPAHKQTHAVAAEFVRQYGILSFGPGDKQALHRAVSELNSRPHREWAAVMEYLTVLRRTDESRTRPLSMFLQDCARLDNSADEVRLAVITKNAAARTRRVRSGSNTTEQVTLPDIDESQAATDAGSIGTFPARTSRNKIAEQLLKPLAARSRHVRIMDPHILEDCITDASAKVEWLLDILGSAMPPDATISLIGVLQRDWRRKGTDAEDRIERLLGQAFRTRDAPVTVEVSLVQSSPLPLKNRFLWFDCGCSFDVLHNFAPLKDEQLTEELRFIRQDEARAKQTEFLAEQYKQRAESFRPGSKVSITKSLGGGTPNSYSSTPTLPSDPNPTPRDSALGNGVRPRPPGRPRPQPPRTRSGLQ